MKLIKPGYTILAMSMHDELPYNYDRPEELIEAAGRTCYKSEDSITRDSCKAFVNMLRKNGHFAMIEHSWMIMKCPLLSVTAIKVLWSLIFNRFLNIKITNRCVFNAGNIRAFEEWKLDENTRARLVRAENMEVYRLKRKKAFNMLSATVKFICDRGVSHELVRHRIASYAQESTRYCNYSKDKFDNQVTFIVPQWITFPEEIRTIEQITNQPLPDSYAFWLWHMKECEDIYLKTLENGWSPQQARSVLPNSLKTEIVVTATWEEWRHIFNLRALGKTGKPHPQMVEIMMPLYKEFRRLQPTVFDL